MKYLINFEMTQMVNGTNRGGGYVERNSFSRIMSLEQLEAFINKDTNFNIYVRDIRELDKSISGKKDKKYDELTDMGNMVVPTGW